MRSPVLTLLGNVPARGSRESSVAARCGIGIAARICFARVLYSTRPALKDEEFPMSASTAVDTKVGDTRTAELALVVNGRVCHLDLDPRTSLLDALREHLHLTGTKKGCDHGQCGACTVLIDGRRINSCLTLALMHDGNEIVTIEGLGSPDALHPMQAAFVEHDGFQCG